MARAKHGLKVKFDGGKSQTVWFTSRGARDSEYSKMKTRKDVVYARKVEKA